MKKLVIIALLAIGFGANAQEKEVELTCITLNTVSTDGMKAKIKSEMCVSLKDNIFQSYVLDVVYTFDIIPNSFRIQYDEETKSNFEIFLATREGKNFRITHPKGGEFYGIEDLTEKSLILYTNEDD